MAGRKKKELISIREFARRMNLSYSVAQRAVKRGRISSSKEGRRIWIEWPAAGKEFKARQDLSKVRKKEKSSTATQSDANGKPEKIDLWNERARKEHFLANIRELDYRERNGELVSAKAVEDAAFHQSRRIRDALLNIPDRIASLVASETDAGRCHEIITRELEGVLNKLVSQK